MREEKKIKESAQYLTNKHYGKKGKIKRKANYLDRQIFLQLNDRSLPSAKPVKLKKTHTEAYHCGT